MTAVEIQTKSQMTQMLVKCAHILLSAENSITSAYELASTPNEIVGTILDAPKQLRDAAAILDAIIVIHRN